MSLIAWDTFRQIKYILLNFYIKYLVAILILHEYYLRYLGNLNKIWQDFFPTRHRTVFVSNKISAEV